MFHLHGFSEPTISPYIIYYINIYLHVTLFGSPTLNTVTQLMSFSAPEFQGDGHIVVFCYRE
jgi:hypothetical protein